MVLFVIWNLGFGAFILVILPLLGTRPLKILNFLTSSKNQDNRILSSEFHLSRHAELVSASPAGCLINIDNSPPTEDPALSRERAG